MTFYKFAQWQVDRGEWPSTLCVKHGGFVPAWEEQRPLMSAYVVFTVINNSKIYRKSRDSANDLTGNTFYISDEDKLALMLQAVVL